MLKSTNQLHIGCIVCSLNWSLAIEYERKQKENRILDELLLRLLLILVTVSDRKKYGKKKKKKKEDCFDIVISKVWQALEKNKIGNGFVFWIMNEITGSVCLILLRTKNWLSLCGWIHDSVNFFTSGCVSLDNKTVTRWMKGHKKF